MSHLEALETVALLRLLPHAVEDGVDELGAFGVVSLGPVVPRSGLTEDEVVWAESLSEGPCSDAVHGAGLEVDEDGARDVLAAGSLVVVDVDALELEVGVAGVGAGRVDPVLVRDDLPRTVAWFNIFEFNPSEWGWKN